MDEEAQFNVWLYNCKMSSGFVRLYCRMKFQTQGKFNETKIHPCLWEIH